MGDPLSRLHERQILHWSSVVYEDLDILNINPATFPSQGYIQYRAPQIALDLPRCPPEVFGRLESPVTIATDRGSIPPP